MMCAPFNVLLHWAESHFLKIRFSFKIINFLSSHVIPTSQIPCVKGGSHSTNALKILSYAWNVYGFCV